MCSLSLFHYSEYLVTAVNNPKSLSLDSFLLNHSLEYTVAALSSWIEFTLENIFWPGWCALLSLVWERRAPPEPAERVTLTHLSVLISPELFSPALSSP